MSKSFAKRCAGLAVLAGAMLAAVPAGGMPSSKAPVFAPKSSMILCQPGFVYRCGPKGCFCVRA